MWDRILQKILPNPPLEFDLGHLFWSLFPEEEDAQWVAAIDVPTFEKIIEIFNFELAPAENNWNRMEKDLQDALMYLVIQVRAIGLSPAIRHRLDQPNFRDSAFFALVLTMENFLKAYDQRDQELYFQEASKFRLLLWECRRELEQVSRHLDEFGVSVNLVFQMARLRQYLLRIDSLIEILITEKLDTTKVTAFLANMIFENQEMRSLSTLISQNISLLARKVVERAAETGEHYITRTKKEYTQMLQAAGGGGAITALTVYVKIGILSIGLRGFMEGLLASCNYAVSFVAIHLAGFTLGTKQPAMTAPAIAAKLQQVGTENGLEELIDEITHLMRSQFASVTGNVLLVVPTVLLIDTISFFCFGHHIVGFAKARAAYESVDVMGPAILYAAFTGILLWLSSMIAGWGDNLFALNSLRKTLARSPTVTALFGRMGARRIAIFFEENISGLLGNISLGFFLGMVPEIMHFFSIPLDVRHVTLSSGNLAAALPVLGVEFLKTPAFWRAVIGIFFIGFMNVTVSFSFAFAIAIKACNINTSERKTIRRALRKRFFSNPLSFFFPVGEVVKKSQEHH
jgi:site-specific recombinase